MRLLGWLRGLAFRHIFTSIFRGALAALIMLSGVAAAAAEASCTIRAIDSYAAANDDQGDGLAAEDPSPDEDGQPNGADPFHCAFSHACQCAAAPASPTVQPERRPEISAYLMAACPPLGASRTGRAERPPQA